MAGKTRYKVWLFCLFIIWICGHKTFAQVPVVSYITPKVYKVNTPVIPLAPNNSGGAVPTTIYGTVSTFAGSASDAAVKVTFDSPIGITKNSAGELYVIDYGNTTIRSISLSGTVNFIAGSGVQGSTDGVGAAASFNSPQNLAADAAGNIYVTDVANNLVRKVAPDGTVTTLTDANLGYVDGPLAIARFDRAIGIAIDKAGNIFVTDIANKAIRKINVALGIVTTFTPLTFAPRDLAIDDNDNLYIHNMRQVFKVTPAGVITTIAGDGTGGATDGPALSASFNNITGMAVDHSGNIYVGDDGNHLIRKISAAGVVSTIAGSGSQGFTNGVGTAASFSVLNQLAMNIDGNLYIADGLNRAIRKVTLTGYTIDKALPPGMFFDGTTGVVYGTPTTTWPVTDYTVTAYNSFGSSSTVLTLSVVNSTTVLPSVITFPPISNKTITDADFSAGATSTNTVTPITYTSSNTAVATVSAAGVIHIVGIGSTTITASQSGNANYTAATPQSQSFTVTPIASVVNIYNTFSPNGDGVNDLWNIPDLAAYPQCLVNVYNRYGTKIFQSRGYAKAWDGNYKGGKVPAGVYYYVINLDNTNTNVLSGYVAVIR
jgi:gliding motility-associated-like protein